MKKYISRKLNTRGETLVETLFALLIAVLGLTMLAGSIVSSAWANKSAKDMSVYKTQFDNTPASATITVTIGDKSTALAVDRYKVKFTSDGLADDSREYYYYETK